MDRNDILIDIKNGSCEHSDNGRLEDSTCETMEGLIVDHYYHECSALEVVTVEEHLHNCKRCKKFSRSLATTLDDVSDCYVPHIEEQAVASTIDKLIQAEIRSRSWLNNTWSLVVSAVSPAGTLLLPGLVSAVLCTLTLAPLLLGRPSIKMPSELLFASAVLWASVYTTLVSAIFNAPEKAENRRQTSIDLRSLVYGVLVCCLLMNVSVYTSLKGGFFSKHLIQSMSVQMPKALCLGSVFAVMSVTLMFSMFDKKRNVIPTVLSVVSLFLAINIPVFFCVSGISLTAYSVLNYVGLVVAAAVAGVLLGRLFLDLFAYVMQFKPRVATSSRPLTFPGIAKH